MMGAFTRTLLVPAVMARAKYCQVINPDKTNSGYGNPSDGIAASLPKTNVNTRVLISGLINAQPMPKTACLYCTPIWRQVKTSSSSCARASSMSPVSYHGGEATIRVTRCAGDGCASAALISAPGRPCTTPQRGSAAVMLSPVGRSAARPTGRARERVPCRTLRSPPPGWRRRQQIHVPHNLRARKPLRRNARVNDCRDNKAAVKRTNGRDLRKVRGPDKRDPGIAALARGLEDGHAISLRPAEQGE